MNLLGKLLGTKKAPASRPAATPRPAPPLAPENDPNTIRVHDAYGREFFITRKEWRDSVLVGNIEKAWNNPDDLYGLILSALNDGFRSDVVKAAEHLCKIDHDPVRGACVWGIVLNEEGRLDDAQAVFEGHIARHGESGVVLTNLAKVHAKRGDDATAGEVLWHALELDPNQDNGMGWYEVIHRERDGEVAGLDALRRVAMIPGSWRAQLWLARAALQGRDLPGALVLYRQALSRVDPAPADALMQMSGDLGNAGHLVELLDLTAPRFDPVLHGLLVGNNLIRAHLDLGQLDASRAILDQLFALNRPDWKEQLTFWDGEIAQAALAAAPAASQEELKVSMVQIEGPVWLKPTSPAAELFPAVEALPVRIAFLSGTSEVRTNSQRIERHLADAPGRLSRAIPLFLAEQVEFRTGAVVVTLVPWIANDAGAFVVAGEPWTDDRAADMAREGDTKCDYVVSAHLRTMNKPWTLDLRLIRGIDGACVGSVNVAFTLDALAGPIIEATDDLLRLLARETGVESRTAPPAYAIPRGNDFSHYLLRLEQLLALRCAAMEEGREGADPGRCLHGERDILDGAIHQCLADPKSVSIRVLMAQILRTMKVVRPDILPEFNDRIAMLGREHPLDEPARSVVQRLLDETLAS